MNKDLTIGKPEKVLWAFCLPLFGSVIFQQLYNIADSLVAGKFIGEEALAAVGNSYEITLIFMAFEMGCNIGCSVVASQLYGSKDYKSMKTAISTSLMISGGICLLLMLLGFVGGGPLLRLIKTPSEVYADSFLYLMIYVGGMPFMFFYNIANGIFSALGDSKTPFIFLAVSSLSNIFVDILFVGGFHMGVAGVAWATFLCQGIASVLSMIFVFLRLKSIPTEGKADLFSVPLMKRFLQVALPSTLQQSFVSVGNIIIQSRINDFGTGVMAGYSAAIKINNMIISAFTTVGSGISNYAGQNYGAGQIKRIRKGFLAGMKMVWIICIPVVAIYLFGAKYLVGFFISNPTEEAMESGLLFLRIVSPFYFVVSMKLVSDGFLRGLGRMKEFMADTFTDLILRVVLSLIFASWWGYVGIWCAWPVGWGLGTALSVWFFFRLFRKGGVLDTEKYAVKEEA